jgi:Sulfatase
MIRRRALATIGGCGIIWTLACGRPAPGAGPTVARNLVLITIDTLRADHVGAYGYRPARTPSLDRLARERALRARVRRRADYDEPSTPEPNSSHWTPLKPTG